MLFAPNDRPDRRRILDCGWKLSSRSVVGRAVRLRPTVEVMESRTLLTSQPLIIAALGDSVTDEYEFYPAATKDSIPIPSSLLEDGSVKLPPEIFLTGRNAARNWVMNIGANESSQLSFGDYTTISRGATRLQGFQQNWALTGTAAGGPNIGGSGTTFDTEYQGIPPVFPAGINPTPGLITQTSPPDLSINDIDVVTIFIGGNDYVAALAAFASDRSNIGAFQTANTNIKNAIADAITSIQTAATAAGNTDLKFVVLTTPDITSAPLIQGLAGGNLFILKIIIGSAAQSLENDLVKTYKDNPTVGVVSSNTVINQFIQNPVIDGVTVDMTKGGQDYTDGFIGDGFHPGTIVQGLIAQAVVAEINTLEGAQVVDPITPAEIVDYARNAQPTIAFTSSTSTATVGQGIRFQAKVTPARPGAPIPTGSVTFHLIVPATSTSPAMLGTVLGIANVSPTGVASVTFDDLPAGSYTIAATYNGDFANDARLSATLTQKVVSTGVATRTSILSTANPVTAGTPITFTAIVSALGTGVPRPTGEVTFREETADRILGRATLNAQGVAKLNVTDLGVGSHKIVASYGGAKLLAGSHSSPLNEVVKAPAPPSRSSTTQIIPTYFVQNRRRWVELEVVVSPVNRSAGTATGEVTLLLGAFQLRTLTLNNGSARIAFPLELLVRRTITAHYNGNTSLADSGSPPVFIRLPS